MSASLLQQQLSSTERGSAHELVELGKGHRQGDDNAAGAEAKADQVRGVFDDGRGDQVFRGQGVANNARASGCSRHHSTSVDRRGRPTPHDSYTAASPTVPGLVEKESGAFHTLVNCELARSVIARVLHAFSFGGAVRGLWYGAPTRPGSRHCQRWRVPGRDPDSEWLALRREMAHQHVMVLCSRPFVKVSVPRYGVPPTSYPGDRTPDAKPLAGVRPSFPAPGVRQAGAEFLR